MTTTEPLKSSPDHAQPLGNGQASPANLPAPLGRPAPEGQRGSAIDLIRLGESQPADPTTALLRSVTVSVVIPTLNEAENLPHVAERLPDGIHQIVVVDGRSTDETVAVALEQWPDATVLTQDGKGKGNALACGFAAATGDIIVMLDADGSTDPAEVPRFVASLVAGADFAKGTRFVTGGGSSDITFTRRMGNKALSAAVNLLWKQDFSDLCYGYNAFWRQHLPIVTPDCSGFEVETLINIRVARSGLKVVEVPSYEANRIHGESNLKASADGIRVLRTIVAERLRPV